MASRAVVFRPINADDVSCTPFEANTTFVTTNTSWEANNYTVRHGIHNVQTTPISASNLSADNIKNSDGTHQTPTWKAIDHMFYRPETKHQPMFTFEHYNPRYTEKNLFYSCSVIAIPYVYHGEKIKAKSVRIQNTGSLVYDKFDLYDDKYGNLRDATIDSQSFAPKKNLVAYWGFNDEFRHFELNFGKIGSGAVSGDVDKALFKSEVNRKNSLSTKAYNVEYRRGIPTTGTHITGSGISARWNSGSSAYVITENHPKFNFRNDEEFAISFWCNIPAHQPYSSSKVTAQHLISKRGVEKEIIRVGKYRRTTKLTDKQVLRNRFPYDICVTNHSHPKYDAGKLLLRRSDGTSILEVTSSMFITASSDLPDNQNWHHIVCQKSGSDFGFWIDGVKDNSLHDRFHEDTNVNIMNPSHLVFGARDSSGNTNTTLSGSLDEIRIYDTYLESSAIESLANNHYFSSSAYQTSVAGNVFYRTGQVVISSPLPKYHYALQNVWRLEHKSSRTIYENEVLCKVPASECNVSMNPTLRKLKSELIMPQFTGSGFKPYITTVGLFDDNAQLLAVAKLARPIQKREDIDMNFLIRWDY